MSSFELTKIFVVQSPEKRNAFFFFENNIFIDKSVLLLFLETHKQKRLR